MATSSGGVIPTMGEELWRIAIPASAILSVITSLFCPQPAKFTGRCSDQCCGNIGFLLLIQP